MKTPLALGRTGVALILFASLLLTTPPTSSAARDSPRKVTCRGPASLGSFFRLVDRRRIAVRRANCKTARKVVRRFPDACSEAYAGQAGCRIRASGRWRCRSRIVGSLGDGAPSKVRCKRRRSRLRFEVAHFPPTEPHSHDRARAARGPFDESAICVDTSDPGRVIPPPSFSDGAWEIHLMRGVSRRVGEDVQRALVARRVSSALNAGLGSQPRNYPGRIPIFITAGDFDRERSLGTAVPTCEDGSVDGIVVTARQPTTADIVRTVAHELFHAQAYLGINGAAVGVPWWEEASATWSEGRLGFAETDMYDEALQYLKPLNSWHDDIYPYAMSRFVQFLDAGGLIGAPEWTLQREVINGYTRPGATAALAAALQPTTTLGTELAAFWGDRLRATPLFGQQLRPTARNARRITVRPGSREISASSNRLDTSLTDFKLADSVKRVEFDFDPPAENGFFWGLVDPNDSRPFGDGDSVSFCVGGGDEDDLEWPGRFPVTFTNGALAGAAMIGTITVRAQTSADQCTDPMLNRACRLFDRAGVQEIVGRPGTFEALSDDPRFGEGSHLWTCFYAMDPFTDPGRDAHLTVVRHRRSRTARRAVRALIDEAGYGHVDIGDAGAVYTDSEGGAVVAVAVGREYAAVQVHEPLGRRGAIRIARRIVRELD